MKYRVSLLVDGRLEIEVEASSFEEARDKAENLDGEYDWDTLEVVSRLDAINAEDEIGNFVDY